MNTKCLTVVFLIAHIIFAQGYESNNKSKNYAKETKSINSSNTNRQIKDSNPFGAHYFQEYKSNEKSKRIFSERKSRVKGKVKYDSPDKFAELHRLLRTPQGEKIPNYPSNYILSELEKANNVSSLKKASSLEFIERGPGNVSGRTRGIVIDAADATHSTWFAGSVSGGIWKTTDKGQNWINKSPNLLNLATTVLMQSKSDPNIIYCGTGEGFFSTGSVGGSGIFKSTDHGETWIQLLSTVEMEFGDINRIIVDPVNSDILLACTNPHKSNNDDSSPSAIYRSTDGGSTWTRTLSTGEDRIQDLQYDPTDFMIQYCSINANGVYKSFDGGLTWNATAITGIDEEGNTTNDFGRIEIAVSPSNPNYVYAGIDSREGAILYVSENKGDDWFRVFSEDETQHNWLGDQGWYDNTIAVHPYNEKIVFMAGIDMWKAEIKDIGQTDTTRYAQFFNVTDGYKKYGKPYVHVDHHSIYLIPIEDQTPKTFWIVNGNDGGVAYSPDEGETWYGNATSYKAKNGGYNTTQFYGVDKQHGDDRYIGGTQDNGTFLSPSDLNVDKTTSYTEAIGGDGFEAVFHYNDPLKMIGSSQNNNFMRSIDGGKSCIPALRGFDDAGGGGSPFVSQIANSKSDPDILMTTGVQGVWRSENFGESWSKSIMKPNKAWRADGTITPIEISIANPKIVWSGMSYSSKESYLFLSQDGGVTFELVNVPINVPYNFDGGTISGISTHPNDMNTAYLTYSFYKQPKILRTSDLGKTWEDITGFESNDNSNRGFPNVATYCVLAFPNSNLLWAGTEIGLFESTDNGLSWSKVVGEFPSVAIWDMKIVDDQVVIGTHGRGIWSVVHPEIKDYKPAEVTLSPVIQFVNLNIDGVITIYINLRDAYDSTHITLNGNILDRLGSSVASELTYKYSPLNAGVDTLQIVSYKNEIDYRSSYAIQEIYRYKQAVISYNNDFENDGDDFYGKGFGVVKVEAFSKSIHSDHPYIENKEYFYNLLVPVVISGGDKKTILEYDDIALIEPGEENSVFGYPNFADFVIVLASKDGINWKPVIDGYNARYNEQWETLFKNETLPDQSHFVHHEINLNNTFAEGDTVQIRFYLYSDPSTVGYGWVIDNVKIEGAPTGIAGESIIPTQFSLSQNYPNPFNPETIIEYSIAADIHVTLKLYDILGREVAKIIDENKSPGHYKERFSAAKSDLSSGIYFYKLSAGNFTSTKKMILLK
ncbi:MAG: T9SS type A sorting domain-containing protein [Melioribacteraceae bacterium]|nr:T9SS type A sorting domain-containing protein [Melioribacteraceae bacterium]